MMEMNKMTETRDYIRIIPLVAGFFAIFAIFSPTAFCYNRYTINVYSVFGTWDWWMWNFIIKDGNSIIYFIYEMDFIIPSIITTSAVLLSAINLLILSVTTRRRTLKTKDFELRSIISAVLLIGVMIYYIIAMDIVFYDGLTINGTIIPAGIHFWKAFQPNFGIFLPFISAALSFIGVGVSRHYSKREEGIASLKMDTIKG